MASLTLRNGTPLADWAPPYIVAEVNTSHFGDPAMARALIDKAAEVGCDSVKFQSWTEDTLYSADFYADNPIARRFVRKFAFAADALVALAEHGRARGIAFASTPYSREEVDVLVERCGVPFVKVASMELTNLPFLQYIARTGVPMVLSTGMGAMEEIARAVEAIEAVGHGGLCLLHCVSVYPAEPALLRLRNIEGLRTAFPGYPIGYSDHSLGTEMAVAATALGACLIEKHFTLDRSRIGMDNQMATEPEEMARLVAGVRRTHAALGGPERVVGEAEREQRVRMRRSVVVTRDLPAGAVLAATDLDAKRPGTGIPPERIATLAGRTLRRAVAADRLLREDDLV